MRTQLTKPSPEGRRAEKSFRAAVGKIVEEHRRLGLPLAVMRQGKAVWVHPKPRRKR